MNNSKTRLAYNIAHPRQPWCMPPTLPGDWTEPEPDVTHETLRMIGAARKHNGVGLDTALHFDRLRTRPLSCYGEAMLLEVQGYDPAPGLAGFILYEGGLIALEGQSSVIHELNVTGAIKLDTDQKRLDYVLLFMNWVLSDDGRFQVLYGNADFAYRLNETDTELFENLSSRIVTEIVFEPDETGYGWRFVVPVLYGQALFAARMRLQITGYIEMEADNPEMTELAIRQDKFEGHLLRPQPHKLIKAKP